jgi:ubiquinone/menaquinone biosynthesis C-methylase UbiE
MVTTNQTHFCPAWLAVFLDNPLRLRLQNPNAILSGLVKEGQTALDLGCGPGVFTQGLANLVGPTGRVVAVDLQQAMLERARVRLKRAGLDERAQYVKCAADRIGLANFAGKVDFTLAFWMVHEVPDPALFLSEVCGYLKPGGSLLIVEPKMHVSEQQFLQTAALAQDLEMKPLGHPKVAISRSVLLQKN